MNESVFTFIIESSRDKDLHINFEHAKTDFFPILARFVM